MLRSFTSKNTTKNLLYTSVAVFALSLGRANATAYTVGNEADLVAAITGVNGSVGPHTITFTGNVTLSNATSLQPITGAVTINGGGYTLSGGNFNQSLVFGSSSAQSASSISNLNTNINASGTQVNAGSTLGISSNADLGQVSTLLTLNGSTLRTDANLTSNRDILLSANSIINSNGKTSTFSGIIGGAGQLTLSGGGQVNLVGRNTYQGGTVLDHVTVGVNNDESFGQAGTSVAVTSNGGTILSLSNVALRRNITTSGDGLTLNNNGYNLTSEGVISGTGGLTTTGAGNTTLLAANTFTGGTTIATGTLTLGNGAQAGSLVGAIVNNGTLAVNNNNAQTLSNPISGSGGLNVNGTGTLTLLGTNTYAGSTNINNGTLQLGNGGTTGTVAGPINIGPNGTMALNHSNPVTLSQPITGTGALNLVGTGPTTIVGNNNTYTGTTTINPNATLQLGNGTANGTVGGNIVNNGHLVFNQATNQTLNGNISGTGDVRQAGTGNTTLAGQTTYTGTTYVDQGTLTVSGTLTGQVQTASGASLVVSGPNVTITGAQTCVTINSCVTTGGTPTTPTTPTTTTPTTPSTPSTPTTPTTGTTGGTIIGTVTTAPNSTLTINGTVTGLATVVANSTLTGTGTAGGTNVSGTFAPGSPSSLPSVMTVNGNLIMNPNSTLQITTSPTGSTGVNVNGTATLTGANLNVVAATGPFAVGTNYTLVHTTGGVNGTFATNNITPTMYGTLILPRLVYGTNDVNLILSARNLAPFAGTNTYQTTMATQFDQRFGNTVNRGNYHALYDLPANQIPQALSQFSGQVTGSASNATLQAGSQFLGAMLNEGVNMDGFSSTSYATPMQDTPLLTTQSFHKPSVRSDLKAHEFNNLKARAPRELPVAPKPRLLEHQAWGAVVGQVGRTNGDAAQGSYGATSRSAGLAGGYTYRPSSDLLVGVALSAQSLSYGVDQGLGSGSAQSIQGGLYGKYMEDNLYMSGALMAGYGSHQTSRTIAFGGFNQSLKGDFGTTNLGARFETGVNVGSKTRQVLPYLAYQFQNVTSASFNEKDANGASVGNSYAGSTRQSHRAEIGLQTASNFGHLILRTKIAYAHEFGNAPALQANYIPLGISFIVPTTPVDRDYLLLSLNADYMLRQNLALFTKVSGEISKSSQQLQGQVGLKATW
jgi:autotransporter-associated beta strand protein